MIRVEGGRDGTFGNLLICGKVICLSLELNWKANWHNISCIPEGDYICEIEPDWFNNKRYGYTYRVIDVPERTGILFHPANLKSELKGCIAPGKSIGKVKGSRGVLSSGMAFNEFKNELGDIDIFMLRVTSLILRRQGSYCTTIGGTK